MSAFDPKRTSDAALCRGAQQRSSLKRVIGCFLAPEGRACKAAPFHHLTFEARWTSPPIAIPFRGLRLRRLFQRPAKRPGKRAEAHYFAAWYQIEQQDLRATA
jgi:hypothetical protein